MKYHQRKLGVMSIREANVNDANEMDRINRLVLTENYPIDFWVTVLMANHSSKYVIEEDSNIVAYIIGAIEEDNQKRMKGHVYSIGVLPSNVRKGYGKQMLIAFENDLKKRFGISKVTLHVRKTNKSAISFYDKCGYQRIKKVKEYYGKDQDGFLFEKNL